MTNEELRQNAAAILLIADGKWEKTQWLEREFSVWKNHFSDRDARDSVSVGLTLRPKPEPRVRPWSKPEDVPGPVCWVRNRALAGSPSPMGSLITCVERLGVTLGSNQSMSEWDVFETLEYSTDRKTWHPCTVTEDAE